VEIQRKSFGSAPPGIMARCTIGAGGKTRDLAKPIPKHTQAVFVILDRISHVLASEIRAEAVQRGLPVFFQRRGRQSRSTDDAPLGLAQWIEQNETSCALRSKSNRY
jgi:hypothetical protein